MFCAGMGESKAGAPLGGDRRSLLVEEVVREVKEGVNEDVVRRAGRDALAVQTLAAISNLHTHLAEVARLARAEHDIHAARNTQAEQIPPTLPIRRF